MKRLLSWLLALVMIISCLPLSALPAFAVETDVDTDFETEEDIIVDFGGELTPIDLTVDLLNEGDFTATVTVPAGKTYHYIAYRVGGMEMTINDGEAVACVTDGMTSPYAWTITNDGEADAEYVIKVSYPAGTLENPAELEINWDNEADIKAGSQGYYYTWTADAAGTLIVTMPEGDWSYVINNMTTYKYGETQWSDSDPVVNPAYVTVAEGDEIQLIVNNYNPEDEFNAPAGVLTFRADLNNEFNGIPVFNNGQTETVTVPAGFTLYYQAFINGMMLTIDGGEPQLIKTANPRMPYVFPLTEGEHTLSIAYPVGTMENPAQLVIGDNAAQIEAGNTMGYFYNYTVEKDGTLVLDIDAGEAGWTYAINNLTTGVYGDTQWSDSDPVVNPAEIEVVAGEELQIIVNTYDPADMWGNPAGTVTINASYKAEGPIADASLKFVQVGLSFQDYIGMNFVITKALADNYDNVYVESVQAAPEGNIEATLEKIAMGKTMFFFDQQIMAWSMTEEVTVTLYAEKDGQLYIGQSVTTSIEALALEKIASYKASNNQKACQTLVDMLNYGAAVQVGYNHNATNVPSAGEYASLGTQVTPEILGTNSSTGSGSIKIATTSVSMQAKVELQVVFKKTDIINGNYELRYTVDGVTSAIPASEFTAMGSTYLVGRIAVKAANMRKDYTAALYNVDTGECVTSVETLSVVAFGQKSISANSYVDVVVALMKYGDSVAAL